MGNPMIGRFVDAEVLPGEPAPDTVVTEEERATVHDFNELVEPLGVAPDPPRCVLIKLKQRDLVWRWLSEPSCKKLGMRMYETYSATAKDRDAINSGRDAPAGVRVDAENKLKWLDDAFLAVIPRRYFLQRQAIKRQRIIDLTKKSRDPRPLKEAAARVGIKADFSSEDDPDVK